MGRRSKEEKRNSVNAASSQQQNPNTDDGVSSQSATIIRCDHQHRGSHYLKRELKPKARPDDHAACELCLIYGLWNLVTPLEALPERSADNTERLRHDYDCFEQGNKIKLRKQRTAPAMPSVPRKHARNYPLVEKYYKVDLAVGHFGEAYHLLICEILRRRMAETGFRFCVRFPDSQETIPSDKKSGDRNSIKQIQDLFRWCEAAHVFNLNDISWHASKSKATRMIAAAFRAANDPDPGNGLVQSSLTESELFEYIRASVGQGPLQGLKPAQSAMKCDAKYLDSAYAAKYWLNRYFRLTQQFGPVERPERKPDFKAMFENAAKSWMHRQSLQTNTQVDSSKNQNNRARNTNNKPEQFNVDDHIYNGLPKKKDTLNVAVIHVRRTPNTDNLGGRKMDDANLKHVLESLRDANDLCVPNGDAGWVTRRFSHVILYGDFDYATGLELRDNAVKTLGNALQKCTLKLQAHAMALYTPGSEGGSRPGLNVVGAMPQDDHKAEGRNYRELKRDWKNEPNERKIHVSFICRPWDSPAVAGEERIDGKNCSDQKAANENAKSKDKTKGARNAETPKKSGGKEVKIDDSERSTTLEAVSLAASKLWRDFRSEESDRLPIQTKILGIWAALRDRYGENLCVIGHRSGFIEGAGLMGIPIFYLNNERESLGLTRTEQSRILYDGTIYHKIQAAENKAASQAGDDSSTKHDQDGVGEGQVNEEGTERKKRLKRLRELSDVMNTFIPIEALEKIKVKDLKPGQAFQVTGKEESKELKAALFTYMCCRLKSGSPAWTRRVVMMHERDEEWKNAVEALRAEDSSYGIKWLWDRVWAARN